MKPTEEQLDQLLSGYLDDALEADELQNVERWLQDDSDVANRLRELVDVRDSVRQVFQQAPTVKLPDRFSTKVLTAAVARAREEGVDESHPLMRVQEQPLTSVISRPQPVSSRRLVLVVATLAACLVALVFAFDLGGSDQAEELPLIAQSDGVAGSAVSPEASSAEVAAKTGSSEGSQASSTLDSVASNLEQETTVESSASNVNSLVENASNADDQSSDPSKMGSSSAAALAAADPLDVDPTNGTASKSALKGAVLVLDIKQSDAGRSQQAVRKAMEAVGIRGSNQLLLGQESLAGLVGQSGTVGTESDGKPATVSNASLLFLQLSAKQFDRFYQMVWSDQKGVDSLAMSIAYDAPILNLVQSIQQDPTTVQHESMAFEIESEEDQPNLLIDKLQQLPLVPMDRTVLVSPGLGSGDDLQTQVLLLVR